MNKYTLESDVDDFVKQTFEQLGLVKRKDYNEKSCMSKYMKEALRGSAKTENKTNYGQPDFTLEKYRIPVVIEDKLSNDRHVCMNKENLKQDDKSIREYAVNGAVYYAQSMIASRKYDEVVAIGISGESLEEIKISIYYVFSSSIEPKLMKNYNNLNFLQNKDSFESFYKDATITDEERHKILIKSRDEILKHAKKLNKLMNNFNIGVEQRVVYVSGMLLSMQDVCDSKGNVVDSGLVPENLQGIATNQRRDSVLIINHLQEYLDQKQIDPVKKEIMIGQFKNSISLDPSRDDKTAIDDYVGDLLSDKASITKQIFCYLYEYIYKAIDVTQGALDIMAEMYSTFLKYALSDGASLGKVLTPPYITNLMARILDIDSESKVMDIATGSAAFLVAAMDLMILDVNKKYGKNTTIAKKHIDTVKTKKLLGIEVDAKMYTLAATNMILRGDGSSNIQKADSFTTPQETFLNFGATKLLLNPPFSYTDFGLPFFEFGLDNMKEGGIGAVIIQDSAGSGKAKDTAKRILSKHTMLASIKMPSDLFNPNAIVQTSIYVFKAHTPHNFDYDIVKFIDFRNDGYKRTERCIKDVDNPVERYNDIYLIYKLGKNASKKEEFHKKLWDLNKCYSEDTISNKGDDWNFEKHIQFDVNPEQEDFISAIKSNLLWDIQHSVEKQDFDTMCQMPEPFKFAKVKVSKVFKMDGATPSYDKGALVEVDSEASEKYDYITRTVENRGICERTGFISKNGLFPRGTFSLGLLQMAFFFRPNEWYAGQFVKIIHCIDDVDDDAKIYLEAILNGLSNKLLSVLVRDVERTFYESEILLPVKRDGKIDYEWMSNYTKTTKKNIGQFIQGLCKRH
jgi:hypothetical protein